MKNKYGSEYQKFCDYLSAQYKDRINIKVVSINGVEKIIGTFDDKDISFEMDDSNEALCMYTREEDANFLQQLVPSINIYRNGEGPIVQYDTYDIAKKKTLDTTIEWNVDPDTRMEMINASRIYDYPIVAKNLVSFFESKEERDRRLGLTSFSPIFFPEGRISDFNSLTAMVDNYNEQDAFLALTTVFSVQRQILNRTWRGIWPDYTAISDATDLILNKVSLFVGSSCNSVSSFLASDAYNSWYDKWNSYFTYENRCQYMEARIKGEDVSSFVPESAQALKKINN